MIKNYFKVAVRNLFRYKGYSILNIAGLSIGLACFTVIMIFVWSELSYDRHFSKADRIYRIYSQIKTSNGTQVTAQTPPGWARYLISDYPEIEEVTRFKPPNQFWKVVYDNKVFYESEFTFADSSVIDMFDVRLSQGDPENALSEPYSVIISKRIARKYFNEENAVGKQFRLDNQYDFTVTGVFEEFPSNTHFNFNFLASFVTLRDPIYGNNLLEVDNFPVIYTYVQLPAGYNPNDFNSKLEDIITKYIGNREELEAIGFEVDAHLQPLSDIHLKSHLENEISANGTMSTIYVFSAIAIFILVIASINFMNLSTARSSRRAQEVGMRKISGASKNQLVGQFLGESILITIISMLVSLVFVSIFLPFFSNLVGKDLNTHLLSDPAAIAFLVGITVLIGVFSGMYPAFFISSFKPNEVLKGKTGTSRGGSGFLRKVLIILQFTISLGLMISTGILYNQMKYIQNLDLGLEEEQVVVVEITDPLLRENYRAFKNRLLQIPTVEFVSASFNAPADNMINQATIRPVDQPVDNNWMVNLFGTDYDFINSLGIELVAGRDFLRENPADTLNGVLINETAVQEFGWESPEAAIGERLTFGGNPNVPNLQVIGVVSDFYMQSVHEKISPMAIVYWNVQAYFYSFIKINSDIKSSLGHIEDAWQEVMLNYPFQYAFLDDNFDKLYKSEETLGKLLTYFAILTVIIACMGLYGLASFMVEQRTKEIGIRKVLGASVIKITLLIANEYTFLILIAFVIASPVAYWFMSLWLQSFEYHISIPFYVFGVSLIAALIISFITVSVRSVMAATSNPINTLRTE